MGPRGMFKKEKDAKMIIKWTLTMHKCKLYIR